MPPKKFYAIAVGRKPGIYENWPVAHAQVQGFPNARFKGFATRAEAERWLAEPRSSSAGAGKRAQPVASSRITTEPCPGEVTIYTDGGARYNPGPGGFGVVQIYNGERLELSGGFRLTTNNRMELMGCLVALRALEYRDKKITLYSDSSYVVNGITRGWARNWRQKGWIKSDKQPALNADLWAELLDQVDGLDVTFKWVKGHAGHPMNERCDELAVAEARQPGLPVDAGYEER